MAEDTHRGFGEVLRQAREDAGLQISDLAATTRIGAHYIAALEAEDWGVVPGSVIGRGFVRVLAREIRQEPGPLLEAYRVARGDEANPDHSLPEADWKVALRPERRRWPLLLGVVAVLLAGVWFWLPRDATEDAPPAAVQAAPAAEPSASAPTTAADAALPATTAGPYRLDIQAVEKVWVRVEADGGEAQDRLLEPGERAEFEAEQGLRVKLGNAGSVRLTWNGTALRVAGGAGEEKTLEFPSAAAALLP
ncbi:MAG: DUF4115 domain-containing protein [Deferrisomatales bacterium]|nr:DUF4115 domain-containing protein [Deferrisomatales bacterium]